MAKKFRRQIKSTKVTFLNPVTVKQSEVENAENYIRVDKDSLQEIIATYHYDNYKKNTAVKNFMNDYPDQLGFVMDVEEIEETREMSLEDFMKYSVKVGV